MPKPSDQIVYNTSRYVAKIEAGGVDGSWGSIVQRFMRAHVVVLVDEALDAGPELAFGRIFLNIYLLSLQTAEPPFDHNVVRPAGLPVHALPDMHRLEQCLIVFTGELAALVRVDNRRNAVALYRFPDGFQDGSRFQSIRQPPAYNLAAIPVDDCGQVHVATLHLDEGDVNRPHLIREMGHIAPEQVWQDSFLKVALRGVRLRVDRVDRHLAHILLNRLPGDEITVVSEQHTDLPSTPRRILCVPVVDERHNPLLALYGFFSRRLGRIIYLRARYAQ